ALILAIADQRAERFSYDDTFRDGDTLRMGGYDWQVIAAPGHDTHAVMFHSPEARVLISGDALWENGFGVVFPQLFGRDTALAELNSRYRRMTPAAMAEWLLNELERAGAVRRNDGRLYATGN